MLRFKLKYRFWGTTLDGTRQVFCMSADTEVFTARGWKTWDAFEDDDELLTLNTQTKKPQWEPLRGLHVFDWDAPLIRWQGNGIDAITTPNHRWVVENDDNTWAFSTTEELNKETKRRIIVSGESNFDWLTTSEMTVTEEPYKGVVWCPQVATRTILARRNGMAYWTGQTYTELITDYEIQEYINDELISSHPNPLGEIPIVHIPNRRIASSPWGMSDIQDIIVLNRQYNETATALADIINYFAAPTTVIVGARTSQLEKGAKKVWGGLPKDAQVYNLEMASDASLAQAFLVTLKTAMHEMTGIPVTALGQEQAVSNTSGVALQIQYQPLMQVLSQKWATYGKGFAKMNELILKTLALKEPELFVYDPAKDPPLKEGQLPILDLRDPLTYKTRAKFHTPLPIDQLIKLNEIMSKMQLGLESKRGALQDLGEMSPDEKMEELQNELMDDAKRQGALDLLKAEIQDVIMSQTISGSMMMGEGSPQPSGATNGNVVAAGGPDVNSAGDSASTTNNGASLPGIQPNVDTEALLAEMSTLSQGTKIPQRRMPNSDNE